MRTVDLGQHPSFIGIGAMKAGTGWFADYLERHPQVCVSPLKELHYFDAVHLPHLCKPFEQLCLRRLRGIVNDRIKKGTERNAIKRTLALVRRLEMVTDPGAYLRHFQDVLEGERIFGEITPSYSMLDRDAFAAMKRIIPRAKILFVLRNPADRFWSHLRFTTRSKRGFSPDAEFPRRLDDPQYVLRTDYRRTMSELRHAVPAEDILVLFYENVFASNAGRDEIRKLTDFLGIDFVEPSLSQPVNVSVKHTLSPELRRAAVLRFAPVYRFAHDAFGAELPPSWGADLDLIG